MTPEERNLPPAPPRPEGKRVSQDFALKEQELLERTGEGEHGVPIKRGKVRGRAGLPKVWPCGPGSPARGPLSIPVAQGLGRGSREHELDPPRRLHPAL